MSLDNFSNLFKEAAKMSKSLAGSAVKAGAAISNGKPIIAGTRISVQTVMEFLAAGSLSIT